MILDWYPEGAFFSIFLACASLTVIIGLCMILIGYKYRQTKLKFGEGTIVASASWLLGMLLWVPLHLVLDALRLRRRG